LKKLRWIIALLALGLLLPVALLLREALESIAVERTMRHRTVADRIIDEMERELTAWLRAEEDRPYDHYRFFYLPPETPRDFVQSPLSEAPSESFVIGYFQIEPDLSVSSPRWPGNEALARSTAAWRPVEETRAEVERLESLVSGLFAEPNVAEPVGSQAAGTTIELSKKKEALEKGGRSSPLEVLGNLNRGVESRQDRRAKTAQSQAPEVYNFSLDQGNLLQQNVLEEAERREVVDDDIARQVGVGAEEAVDVRLEPMVGRDAGEGRTALYRTVTIGQQAYRQGLLLGDRELIAWLRARVLESQGLGRSADLWLDAEAPQEGLGVYVYRHRFAEPFGTITATLALAPLPDSGQATYLYTLAALLVLASTVGLFALYRAVAVVVSYAERRNNFVSAVTHELKTPLTAIRMYGEMLRDNVITAEAKRHRYYKIITAESERLTRLVQNVLELARLENGPRKSSPRESALTVGDVGPVIEEVLGVIGPHAEAQGFELRREIESDLPPVCYDRDDLMQVLFNLVDNALKYARGHEPHEVVLSCRRAGAGVAVTVSDHGPGVAKRQLEKIFEPFYRGESELTRTAKGTGIGLALVRGMVERMGGEVEARNRREGGFEVSLRLAAVSG